jgi:hypothetical protein
MLLVSIRVIYVCDVYVPLCVSLWEKEMLDCLSQTLCTMLQYLPCTFVVIFCVLWIFIFLKCRCCSERALKKFTHIVNSSPVVT